MKIPNLLLIAGTGNKSGKTSMACKIIESLPGLRITAIKITPHFHEITEGLVKISEDKGYILYRETNNITSKDTSRMLQSGAEKVYFAQVLDDRLYEAFNEIMKKVPEGVPVICESPALRYFIEPGLFVIMTSDYVKKQKNINHLQNLPHMMLSLEEVERTDSLPIGFKEGKWFKKI